MTKPNKKLNLEARRYQTTLPVDLAEYPELRSLSLRGYLIQTLPAALFRLTKLSHLYLFDLPYLGSIAGVENMLSLETLRVTGVPRLPVADVVRRAARLPQLGTLFLGPSALAELPAELDELGQVLKLNLYRFAALDLAAALPRLAGLPGLRELWLVGPKGDLPDLLDRFTRLTALAVQGSTMRALPPSIGALPALERLDVSRNRLTKLAPELGRLSSLVELDASYNQLRSLPAEIAGLRALKRVDVRENKLLKKLPDGLMGRRGLEVRLGPA